MSKNLPKNLSKNLRENLSKNLPKNPFASGLLAIAMTGFLTACGGSRATTTAVVVSAPASARSAPKHGPPPHAPAHGYRYKHGGDVELVYDAELQVYLVVGVHGRYYANGNYYRKRGTQWMTSAQLDGPWILAKSSKVPGRLVATNDATGKTKGKGKKNPGKGGPVN